MPFCICSAPVGEILWGVTVYHSVYHCKIPSGKRIIHDVYMGKYTIDCHHFEAFILHRNDLQMPGSLRFTLKETRRQASP